MRRRVLTRKNPSSPLRQVFDESTQVPGVGIMPEAALSPPWPAGMTPPLHPDEAAAIATVERGGGSIPAAMAIDPQLINLSGNYTPMPSDPSILTPTPVLTPVTPAPVLTPALPKPKPAYQGSASFPHTNTNTFGLPPRYRPSGLFDAFRSSRTPQTPQIGSPAAVKTPPSHVSPLASKSTGVSKPAGTTSAARLLTDILASHVTPLAQPAMQAPAPAPSANVIISPTSRTTLLTPPPATTTAHPLTPPAVAPPVPPPVFELPGSRPQVKPAPKPLKSATGKRAQPRKTSTAGAAVKEAAAAGAAKVASVEAEVEKKKRGRPRKDPLVDITNATLAATNANSASAIPDAAAPPVYILSSTNNNRAAARQAAEREKAAAEKAAADAAAAQAAKGWTEKTVDGATVITFTRVRKPAKLPDGSTVQPEVKKTRAKKTDSAEAKLLARAGTKRKAADSTAEKGKRYVEFLLKFLALANLRPQAQDLI